MNSTENSEKRKSDINRLTKYLAGILKKYAVLYNVRNSDFSESRYISFFYRGNRYTFRISDHPLPKQPGHYNKFFHNFRPLQFKKGKQVLIGILKNKEPKSWDMPRWAINIDKMVYEYNRELEVQDNIKQFQRWSNFFYALNAISPGEKKKLYRLSFSEVLEKFKLPEEMPSWIDDIVAKYI